MTNVSAKGTEFDTLYERGKTVHHNEYIIGVDIGTTSTKAVLYTTGGEPILRESVEYPLHVPSPAAAEQDPEEIFQAVIETISRLVKMNEIDPARLRGVSFSAAMHSLIAVDAADVHSLRVSRGRTTAAPTGRKQ